MTTKKFLTAEEVIELYGVDEAVLGNLVKEGSLKALADRGGYKFRRDDIDRLVRENVIRPTKELPVVGEEGVADVLTFADEGSGSSAVDFLELDEEAMAEQPTMITSGKDASLLPKFTDDDSDDSSSEVNVVLEPVETDFSDSEIRLGRADDPITGNTSDSDVKAVSGLSAPLAAAQSDSDVKTLSERESAGSAITGATSDSDVKTLSSFELATPAEGTDSDVATIPSGSFAGLGPEGSDSDVKTLSSFEMAAADSGLALDLGDSHTQEIELEEDDGISLPPRNTEVTMEIPAASDSTYDISSDSALKLDESSIKSGDSSMLIDDPGSSIYDEYDEADSGITLDTGDSGISLETADSGISLDAGDSGITLDTGDSGITLAADSGISIEEPSRKPAKLDKTEAMFDIPEDDFDLGLADEPRAAAPSEDELEATTPFQLGGEEDSATMPTLLGIDEDDEEAPPKKRDPLGFSGAIAAGATIENLEVVDDLDQMTPDTHDETDAIFEDEEAEVLEASDESFAEFDEAPSEDMLSEEFEAPVAAAKKEPKEKGWGALATMSILAASVLLAANGWILWEGISTMWTGAAPAEPAASIISSLAGMF